MGTPSGFWRPTSPDGRLLGLDADRAAVRRRHRVLARFGDRVILRQANFESLYDAATDAGLVPLDGVLFDLGLSSYQLADPRPRIHLRGRRAAGHEIR